MANRLTSLLAALLLASVAHGQVLLNKFGPVTGVLVGTAGDAATAAATIADLQPLLSTTPGLVLNSATGGSKGAGTINATGLYVNGSAVGVGGGAVSSVGLTAPACFGVTGSPVTAAGSLGLTLTGSSSQYVGADGACHNLPSAVTPGGSTTQVQFNNSGAFGASSAMVWDTTNSIFEASRIFAGTVSGYPGSTSPISAAVSTGGTGNFFADYDGTHESLFGTFASGGFVGTFSAHEFDIRSNNTARMIFSSAGNVTINAPSSGTALGVSGVLGSDTAVFDSLHTGTNVGISSGSNLYVGSSTNLHIGTTTGATGTVNLATAATDRLVINSSGNVSIAAPSAAVATLSLAGAANVSTFQINGSSTTGQSYGATVVAGSNSTDYGFYVQNIPGSALFKVAGDGGVVVGAPSGGDKGAGSINAQSIFVNNVPVVTGSGSSQQIASVFGNCTSGGCTATNAKGISTSITRNSAGNYTVTLSPAFSAQPACVVSSDGVAGGIGTFAIGGTASGTVETFVAAVATDMAWSLICTG